MFNALPFVSVIIPCRNEEKFIEGCLNSIVGQDYPKENLEVLVIDGISEDKTQDVVKKFAEKYHFIKLLENHKKFTPFGLNIGVKNAKGEIIIRMDAHAGYEKNYISKCLKYLKEYDADNVGGVIKTKPADNTLISKSIANSLSSFFGAGSSYFRIGVKEPKWVDTVFGGCYKRKVFEKIGYFNEKLIRSQDLEFNLRLKKAGGKILLVPEIVAYYYPSSNFRDFVRHNFSDGVWVTYPLKFGIRVFKSRHLISLIFTSGVILALIFSPFSFLARFLFVLIFGSYLILNLFFSLKIAWREKESKFLFILPVVFASRHIGYGLGSLRGFLKILDRASIHGSEGKEEDKVLFAEKNDGRKTTKRN